MLKYSPQHARLLCDSQDILDKWLREWIVQRSTFLKITFQIKTIGASSRRLRLDYRFYCLSCLDNLTASFCF